MLSSVTDGLNEMTTLTYDPLRVNGVSFSGDGGVTPARTYTYDADNRPLSIASTGIGTQSYTYDNTGNVTQSVEPSGLGITSPGTLAYAYYPNGARQALSLSSSGYSQTNLQQYSYRADGLPQTLNAALLASHGPYKWTYTNAGRMLTQTDPYTGLVISNVNSPYSGSYTLSPTTKTYDTYGRVASETLPMTGQYTNYTYDPEGEVTGYTGFYAPGDITGNYGKRQASYTYSARGELVGVHHTDIGNSQFNPAWPHYNMNAANGFLYPQVEPSASPPPTFTFDALDDMALQKNQTSNGSQKTYTRDVIGRQNKATLSGGSLSGNYTRSYDAEDHLIKHIFTTYTTPSLRPDCVGNDADDAKYTGTHTYAWGPNGHPIKMDNETLHWDGDMLLYTSNSSGVVDDVKTGLLADSSPALSANVAYDRDDSGVVVSNHNSTGFAGWDPPDAYGERCSAGPPPSSTSYQNAYVTKTFGPVSGPASDGITDTYNVVQGGHGYDSKVGQWLSPDAASEFSGDPPSGKPLLWNRNNSLAFIDPSGLNSIDVMPDDACPAGYQEVGANSDGSIKCDDGQTSNLTTIATVRACPSPALPPCGDFTPSGVSDIQNAYEFIAGANVLLGFVVPGGEELSAENLGARLIGRSFGKLGTVVKNPRLALSSFSAHGLNQLITRGVSAPTLLETIRNPSVVLQQSAGQYLYLSDEAGVVLSPTGRVITGYPSSMFTPEVQGVLSGFP